MKSCLLILTFLFSLITICHAQKGAVDITEPALMKKLMVYKIEANKKKLERQTFKIQIFSGTKTQIDTIKQNLTLYINAIREDNNLKSEIIFDTPNYKIQIGDFTTQLKADRWLLKIRKRFPSAFII